MFGRRSHDRFRISTYANCVFRMRRDVIVHQANGHELIAISREAGTVGETLTVEVAGSENSLNAQVRVLESRPIVIDGSVRHRLRLQPIESR